MKIFHSSQKFFNFNFLRLALFVFCFTILTGCEAKKIELPRIELGVPAQIHQRMVINVISYKLVAGDKDIPLLGAPQPGKKYLVIRMILKNPGLNRGVLACSLGEVLSKVTVSADGIKEPIEMSLTTSSDSLETMRPLGSSVLSKKIPAGESLSVWIKGDIDSKIPLPYKVTFFTKKSKEVSRDVMIELK